MKPLEIVHRRMATQRLTGAPFRSAPEAVSSLLAVQAQEFAEVKFSISERTGGLTDAEVEAAFDRGEILRTHVLRPTWHFVSPEDIRWLLALTGPRVRAALAFYDRKLELDEAARARAAEIIGRTLADADGPLMRSELASGLAASGIEASGQRLSHIVMHAELDGLICNGPRRGKQHTYLLLDERVPPGRELEPRDALAELTLRYFRGHGPATVRDLSWWSGLTMTDVKAGLADVADQLRSEVDAEGTAWYSADGPETIAVPEGAHLIQTYDEIGVAYKDQRMVYAAPPPEESLWLRPLLVGGRTVGSWSRTLTANSAIVRASLYAKVDGEGLRAIDEAVQRFSRFLEMPVALEIERTGDA